MAKELPVYFKGHKEFRSPAMKYSQACGWKDDIKIQYFLVREDHRLFEINDKILNYARVSKVTQKCPDGLSFGVNAELPIEKNMMMYIDQHGNCYNSLSDFGSPICNFFKGVIYDQY